MGCPREAAGDHRSPGPRAPQKAGVSPLALLEGTCWSLRHWRRWQGAQEKSSSEPTTVTIISCVFSTCCCLTASADYYLSLHGNLHSIDGEKPGSALMLTFPHHKPLQPLQSPAVLDAPLPLSSSLGGLCLGFQSGGMPFLPPLPPGEGSQS